jgi:AraC-like DNA-binding protein
MAEAPNVSRAVGRALRRCRRPLALRSIGMAGTGCGVTGSRLLSRRVCGSRPFRPRHCRPQPPRQTLLDDGGDWPRAGGPPAGDRVGTGGGTHDLFPGGGPPCGHRSHGAVRSDWRTGVGPLAGADGVPHPCGAPGVACAYPLRLTPGGTRHDCARLARPRSLAPPQRQGTGGLAPSKLRRTIAYIRDHLEQALSQATLAAVAQTSPAHFARQFKRVTGRTPHQYVITCRMEYAKRLLVETDVPLIEIGPRWGARTKVTSRRSFGSTSP